jgi:hypothetical protein
MPRRDRQSPSPRADPVRIRNGSETPVALTRNAAYGRLKNRHAVDFCLRRSSSVPQRQRRETHRPQRGLAPQSGKCKPDFSSAGTGRSAETTQSAMLSPVPAACKGSRLPQALASERLQGSIAEGFAYVDVVRADRYISDHGILLGQCGVAVCAAMMKASPRKRANKSPTASAWRNTLVATDWSRRYHGPGSSMRLLVTDRPHIIGYRGQIGLGELSATHRRHRTRVVLGLRYAVRDCPGNRLDAAVAP